MPPPARLYIHGRFLVSPRHLAHTALSLTLTPFLGFSMSYGVFQEYYFAEPALPRAATGIIGTTFNGVTYLAMPALFALLTRRFAHRRRAAALAGAVLTGLAFALSSAASHIWHLVAAQYVVRAGTLLENLENLY
jgi:hypothetical protein